MTTLEGSWDEASRATGTRTSRAIEKRLELLVGGTAPRAKGGPEFTRQRPSYEIAQRTRAIPDPTTAYKSPLD